ncbi:MAG: hypothetical protein HRU19_13180 [Pseudobacteriovorax sp.]|nr:hypothetical protein [Pseudobacteriovorax sp.]
MKLRILMSYILFIPIFFSCGDSDSKEKGNEPLSGVSFQAADRRSFEVAVSALKEFDQLDPEHSFSTAMELDGIINDIAAAIPDQDKEQLKSLVDYLDQRNLNRSGGFLSNTSLNQQNRAAAAAGEHESVSIPSRHTLRIPVQTFCLDVGKDSPGRNVRYRYESVRETNPLTTLVLHHARDINSDDIDYQDLIWDIQDEEGYYDESELKKVLDVYSISISEDASVGDLRADVGVIAAAERVIQSSQGIAQLDIQMISNNISQGTLVVYNPTNEEISIAKSDLLAKMKPITVLGSNSSFLRRSRFSNSFDSPQNQSKLEYRSQNHLFSVKRNISRQRLQSVSGPTCSEPDGQDDSGADVQPMGVAGFRHDLFLGGQAEHAENLRGLARFAMEDGRDEFFLRYAADTLANGEIAESLHVQGLMRSIEFTDDAGVQPEIKLERRLYQIVLGQNNEPMDKRSLALALIQSTFRANPLKVLDAIARSGAMSMADYQELRSVTENTVLHQSLRRLRNSQPLGGSFQANERSGERTWAEFISDLLGAGLSLDQNPNPGDVQSILENPCLVIDLYNAYQISKTAFDKARSSYPNGIEDGFGDAYRHALWNAMMANDLGAETAAEIGDGHENFPGNDDLKKEMDLHNNQLGRDVQKELTETLGRKPTQEELEKGVADALKEGRGKVIVETEGGRKTTTSDKAAP